MRGVPKTNCLTRSSEKCEIPFYCQVHSLLMYKVLSLGDLEHAFAVVHNTCTIIRPWIHCQLAGFHKCNKHSQRLPAAEFSLSLIHQDKQKMLSKLQNILHLHRSSASTPSFCHHYPYHSPFTPSHRLQTAEPHQPGARMDNGESTAQRSQRRSLARAATATLQSSTPIRSGRLQEPHHWLAMLHAARCTRTPPRCRHPHRWPSAYAAVAGLNPAAAPSFFFSNSPLDYFSFHSATSEAH